MNQDKINEKKIKEKVKKALGQDVEFLSENDTFNFHCVQCGQCCMNREDITLNPFDIYNGAKYLGITCKEFFDKYCYMTLGSNSKIPMVLLKTSKDNGYCPLLKFDVKDGGKFKCTINPAKPGACSNHPIGVCFGIDINNNTNTSLKYIKVAQCENSKSDEVHTVKDWVKPYTDNITEINIAHCIQSYIISFVDPKYFFYMCKFFVEPMIQIKDTLSDKDKYIFDTFLNLSKTYVYSTIDIGYLSYDINKPFIEQAESAKSALEEIYLTLKSIYESVKKTVESSKDNIIFEEFLNEAIENNKED